MAQHRAGSLGWGDEIELEQAEKDGHFMPSDSHFHSAGHFSDIKMVEKHLWRERESSMF